MLWHVFVRPPEEVDLEKRFGMAYQKYQKNVKCWIPTFNTPSNKNSDT
jgi:protein-S-isoprenylcysteine O-methyltransferase Ste14